MKKLFFVILLILGFFLTPTVSAQHLGQEKRAEAKITNLSKQVTVEVLTGADKGKEFTVTLFDQKQIASQKLRVGDTVIISSIVTPTGSNVVIVDHVRRTPLMVLFALFVGLVIIVGRRKGFLSFLGMLFSFALIGRFIVPQILLGNNPIFISMLGALFIIPVTFYIAHGISWKTTVAVVSTFLSLLITGILAVIFVHFAKLTGFAAEEAVFLQSMTGQTINLQTLLLGGIIIGAMGVLDDITISQTSIVAKLYKTNPKFSFKQLFAESMDIGRDHIASLVNTLILVYAGASLPLFVLFYGSTYQYSELVNMEIIATEIVRTLVSSIGIVAAVPITTVIACWYVMKQR
ncbi:MAG: YibE/F family protein [Weeksellaceae bacterium]